MDHLPWLVDGEHRHRQYWLRHRSSDPTHVLRSWCAKERGQHWKADTPATHIPWKLDQFSSLNAGPAGKDDRAPGHPRERCCCGSRDRVEVELSLCPAIRQTRTAW